MNKDYDADEFMNFMDEFLRNHPEVVKDQQFGWDIYWNPSKAAPIPLHFPRTETGGDTAPPRRSP